MNRKCDSRSVRAALKNSGFARFASLVYRNKKRRNGVDGTYVRITLKLGDFHFTAEELFQARTILGAYYHVLDTFPTCIQVGARGAQEVE